MKYFTTTTISFEGVQKIITEHTHKINEDVGLLVDDSEIFIASICDSLNNELSVSPYFSEVTDFSDDKLFSFLKNALNKRIIGNKHLIPAID